jgi:hypothetical protein
MASTYRVYPMPPRCRNCIRCCHQPCKHQYGSGWRAGIYAEREALGVSIPYRALLKTARARQAMGQSVDVPLRYTVDARQAQATLQSLARNINRAPKPLKSGYEQ